MHINKHSKITDYQLKDCITKIIKKFPEYKNYLPKFATKILPKTGTGTEDLIPPDPCLAYCEQHDESELIFLDNHLMGITEKAVIVDFMG